MPPVTLSWRRAWISPKFNSIFRSFRQLVSGLGLSEFGPTLPKQEGRPSLPRRQYCLHELVLQMYSV